jgi:hypothetical protein
MPYKKKRSYPAEKTTMKPMDAKTPNYKRGLQHDVEKAIKPDKINPKKIFEGSKTKSKKTKSKTKSKSKY